MLLEFGFRNFFSFKEGMTVSFKLDKNCPESISGGLGFSTAVGIMGANGSGKTHVLRGLTFIAQFGANSFADKPDAKLYFEPFYYNEEPTEFYIEFGTDKFTYLYELEATKEGVLRETIYRRKAQKIKILERLENTIHYTTKDLSHLLAIKLRRNASIISAAHQYELTGLEDLYNFFNSFISNVSYLGFDENPRDLYEVSKMLKENENLFNYTLNLIKKCDTGITNIVILDRETENGRKEFFPVFYHKTEKADNWVVSALESSGTKQLFRDLFSYKRILDMGGILIVDEFGANLHPFILPVLIEEFLNPKTNQKNAQILFSTHDTCILDLLGRYRTYLVNKKDNESFAYRLDEIPGDILRNDRSILPPYNDGKIGGVPEL